MSSSLFSVSFRRWKVYRLSGHYMLGCVCVRLCSAGSVFSSGHTSHANCSQGQSLRWALLSVYTCVCVSLRSSLLEWHVLIKLNLISWKCRVRTGPSMACWFYCAQSRCRCVCVGVGKKFKTEFSLQTSVRCCLHFTGTLWMLAVFVCLWGVNTRVMSLCIFHYGRMC